VRRSLGKLSIREVSPRGSGEPRGIFFSALPHRQGANLPAQPPGKPWQNKRTHWAQFDSVPRMQKFHQMHNHSRSPCLIGSAFLREILRKVMSLTRYTRKLPLARSIRGSLLIH
jgi:hypothetical protein